MKDNSSLISTLYSTSTCTSQFTHIDIYSVFENDVLRDFFKSILENLNVEFNTYFKHSGEIDIFDYNERVFVGFLNNAIIRNDSDMRYSSLQEYAIYDVGRADLLTIDNITNTYVLFEAKKKKAWPANELKDWMLKESTSNLKALIEKQPLKYYHAEKDFYSGEGLNLYLCAVYFENISNIENPRDLNLNDSSSGLLNTFYTVYYFDTPDDSFKKNGLAVYGHLIDAKIISGE
jgi:hypothetical protein